MVKDVRPSPDGKPQKIKVKARINLHGIMTITSASLLEAKESVEESPENEKMNVDTGAEQQQQQQQNGEQQTEPDENMDGAKGQQQKAEVGSGYRWTKKFTSWLSGVRILMLPAASLANRLNLIFPP